MAGTGLHSVVANSAQMCTADCHTENNLTAECHEENNPTADCHSQESKFENCLPRGYSCCGKPGYTLEWFAKGLLQSWQHWYWSAVCHKKVKSSNSHFTSTVPLFVVQYVFDARLSKCKTYTRQIV
jgi:hypothetical protein